LVQVSSTKWRATRQDQVYNANNHKLQHATLQPFIIIQETASWETGCGKSKLSLGIQTSVAVKNLKYQHNHTNYLI